MSSRFFLKQPLILHLPFVKYYCRNFPYILSFNSHSTPQRNNSHTFQMRKMRLKLNDLPRVTEKGVRTWVSYWPKPVQSSCPSYSIKMPYLTKVMSKGKKNLLTFL